MLLEAQPDGVEKCHTSGYPMGPYVEWASVVAREAGTLLVEHFERGVTVEYKPSQDATTL